MRANINGISYSDLILEKGGFVISYAPKKTGTDRKSIGGKKYSGSEGRVANITLSTVPMDKVTMNGLLSALSGKYAEFNYDDPLLGDDRTIEVIPSVTRIELAIEDINDTDYFYGITFTLEERG